MLYEVITSVVAPSDAKQFGQDVFAVLAASLAELLDRRQIDRQVVPGKAQHPGIAARRILDDLAIHEPQDDRVSYNFV